MIEVISSHTCQLNTPLRIHNIFHVMLLKHAVQDLLPSQDQDNHQPPALISDIRGEEYKVEGILGSYRVQNHRIELYVK